jgi:hypothetical protein
VMDVPDGYLTAVSESGYSNDDLALSWLKHFNKMTIKRTRGAWRLLLVDGHASHATREFITYAQDSHIQVYSLPPHTTHLLQPLDVGCFSRLNGTTVAALIGLLALGRRTSAKLTLWQHSASYAASPLPATP